MAGVVVYLTLEQVLFIHEDQIKRYGGSTGLRDIIMLESAVYRPQTTFNGEDLYDSLFEKAASLFHSLLFNHPFVDGNKRTALVSAIIFLELNGIKMKKKQQGMANMVTIMLMEHWDINKITKWLKENYN